MGSFKAIVKSVDDYFSTSPIVLYSEDIGKYSPSGKICFLIKYEKLAVSYDIEKTNSLVSPYTAYIVLNLKASSNGKFGDLKQSTIDPETGKDAFYNWGFQKAEDALNCKELSSCAPDHFTLMETAKRGMCSGEIKLLYAFQENKWVFKDAVFDKMTQIIDGSARIYLHDNFLKNAEWQRVLSGKNK
jgi:hypothetical protein